MKKLLSILIALMGIGLQVGFGQCTTPPLGTPQINFDCSKQNDSALIIINGVSNVDFYKTIFIGDTIISYSDSIWLPSEKTSAGSLKIIPINACGEGIMKRVSGYTQTVSFNYPPSEFCGGEDVIIATWYPTPADAFNNIDSKRTYLNDSLISSSNEVWGRDTIPSELIKDGDVVSVEIQKMCPFNEKTIFIDTIRLVHPDSPKVNILGSTPKILGKNTRVDLIFNTEQSNASDYSFWRINGQHQHPFQDTLSVSILSDTEIQAVIQPSCGKSDTATVNFKVFNKTIEGQVFYDLNQNCQKDSNETWANNILLKVSPLDVYTTTNDSGYYYTSVPVGEYELLPIPSFKNQTVFAATCSENGVELTNHKPIASVVDFGIEADSLHYVNISASSGRIRPGFIGSYSILLTNYGAYKESGEVYFVLDSRLEEITSVPSASRIEGDTLFWDFSNWEAGQRAYVAKVGFRLPANIDFLGDTIVSTAGVLVANNKSDSPIKEVRTVVTGSYDPNDKQVVQTEVLEEQYKLDYKIRFQNTGTDKAFLVVVRDTISSLYDLSTLEVGAASHHYDFSIEPNNVLQWVFRDILLPDSTTNEPESHGFLTFSIERKKDLFIGDSIVNKAEIYFDYNPEIVTNWARTDIVAPKVTSTETSFVEESSIVYPNPSSGTITLSSPANGVLSVRGLSGMLVKQIAVEQGLSTINLSELDRGIYILELRTEKGRMQSKLVIE